MCRVNIENKFKLVVFGGCPNAHRARELLGQAGVTYLEICQDGLASNDPYLQYTSPTLLKGVRIVFGSKTTSSSRGCSIGLPTLDQLKRLLARE